MSVQSAPAPASRRRAPAEPAAVPGSPERFVRAFRAIVAACFAGSLAISYPLWLSGRDYPLVPLIDGTPQPPAIAGILVFGMMLAALAGVAVLPKPRICLQAVLAIGGFWALLDQTRWQPWFAFYLVAMAALLLHETVGPRARGKFASAWELAPLQLFVVCTYAWSGLHKLNHHYLATDFLLTARPLLGWLGMRPADVPAAAAVTLGLLSAAIELGCGVMLMVPRRRRVAVVGLTAMHLFILLMIGPLGADWNRVVWPWNLASVAALWLLFWPDATHGLLVAFMRAWRERAPRRDRRGPAGVPAALRWASVAVLLVFGVFPALSLAGTWYASLSFQLYAGKERIALIYFDPQHPEALPPAARTAVKTPGQVNVAAWALSELNATPVLEERVLVRLARTLARRAPQANVALLVASPPALFTGERTTKYIVFRGPDFQPVDASAEYTVQLHED
jgi:hypothetical protein